MYKGSKRQRFVDLQFCLSLVGGSVAVVDGFIIDIDINITLHGGIIINGCHHVLIKSAIMRSIYISLHVAVMTWCDQCSIPDCW